MGPRASLAVVAKRKILPYRGSNPGSPARSLFITLELYRQIKNALFLRNRRPVVQLEDNLNLNIV
jgi:hypothetical protein